LEAPKEWEIISVDRESGPIETDDKLLGYDLGCWQGPFSSILSDTVVRPVWHPPHPKDFAELAEQLRDLNQSVLFDTPEQASAFAVWYLAKPWADHGSETSLQPVRIGAVEPTTNQNGHQDVASNPLSE
jgi:hypothetical protein